MTAKGVPKPQDPVPLEEQEPYWKSIFKTKSVRDERNPGEGFTPDWSIMEPVNKGDVQAMLKKMKGSAPGLTVKDVRGLSWKPLQHISISGCR